MSQINSILEAVKARVETIIGVRTVVKHKRQQFSITELPAIAVYRGPTAQDDESPSGSQKIRVPVLIEYHDESLADDAAQAESMVEAVIAAVEVEDEYLSGLLCDAIISDGGDNVLPPDAAGGIVAVQVPFSAVFIRKYGGGV